MFVVILDYSTGEVFYDDLPDDVDFDNLNAEDFLGSYGLKESECVWMFTQIKPTIQKISKL